ncbi:nucleotidyltransferase family protein [Zavarzinia sp.]|uniref:nucleotidyltransferase family protein n=1 Tax=Zavarzinia sp. TaxID=2027920 RepID=UPI0035630D17
MLRHAAALAALVAADPQRRQVLAQVRRLGLPQAWVAAGFVRNLVWDHLHGRPRALTGDVDVIWFDPARADPAEDRAAEVLLAEVSAGVAWSVKNQARMHVRNGDQPYASALDAMRHWPETATAVAVRLTGDGRIAVAAPFGLDDLFALRLVPTPAFAGARRAVIEARAKDKAWRRRYPELVG